MELRHLKYFISVAEERNFNRAAARLHVSQPAVSRQIADLEIELGVRLFARSGHGVELSYEGEIMLCHAKTILRHCVEATTAMLSFQKAFHAGNLVIGYVGAEMGTMLTSALRRFKAAFPHVEFTLLEMSPHDQMKALASSEVDVALVGNPYQAWKRQFSIELLQQHSLHAIVADHHQLASRKQVTLRELANDVFVGFCEEAFPGRNDSIIEACLSAGFRPNIRHFVNGVSNAFGLVGAGKGVTLVAAEPKQLPAPRTVFLELKPAVAPLSSVAATRKHDDRIFVRKLIEFCRESTEHGDAKLDTEFTL